ncbi:OLC1v1021189C1 [Oldenlandia corymbosa var. corymbosa]|uniref:OLC1v1021189C1 n=1 Tax=Oldenlandia corymbosa var. corymbosa TaxID=529605 RepID=A0AAV1BYQ9_OLDCO|nr:OLC1v1021189C1 [Oldenlandia corymbosa var. corymbosa]
MGCCVSKVDDLPLVIRCRERKDLLKSAANHRYALAAAHLSYFIYLKDVGEALRKFVDEELVYNTTSSSSSTSSPIVTFHPINDDDDDDDEDGHNAEKRVKKLKSSDKSKISGSDASGSALHHVHHDDDDNDSHLHLSGDDSDSDGHSHVHVGSDDDDHEAQGGFRGVYTGYYNPGFYYPGGYSSVPYGYETMDEPINQAVAPPYWGSFPNYLGEGQPYQAWAPPSYENPDLNYRHTNVYYMKKSSPKMRTVIHDPGPATNGFASHFVSHPYENEGFYGVPMGPPLGFQDSKKQSGPKVTPPPPSPKGSSAWDFFNVFEYNGEYDAANLANYEVPNGYGDYGVSNGYESSFSSPDSAEVRKREGIPDLEEETENEVYGGELEKGERMEVKSSYAGEGSSKPKSGRRVRAPRLHKISEDSSERERGFPLHDGAFKSVPLHRSSDESSRPLSSPSPEGQTFPGKSSRGIPSEHTESPGQTSPGKSSRRVPSEHNESPGTIHLSEEMSSSETILSSKSPQDAYVRKKEVSFEVNENLKSEMAALSSHGTRDLREVVAEIRDEFAVATEYGKEVALMLEVGKLPYRHNFLKELLSRLLKSSSGESFQPSATSARLASKTHKLAKSYFGDDWENIESPYKLSSTLEKLYVWEKKLYKAVKAEEKLRIINKKQREQLTLLDKNGSEPSKIDAIRASIRNSETKLNICFKTITAIAIRIDKLRDEELQPQVAGLVQGYNFSCYANYQSTGLLSSTFACLCTLIECFMLLLTS